MYVTCSVLVKFCCSFVIHYSIVSFFCFPTGQRWSETRTSGFPPVWRRCIFKVHVAAIRQFSGWKKVVPKSRWTLDRSNRQELVIQPTAPTSTRHPSNHLERKDLHQKIPTRVRLIFHISRNLLSSYCHLLVWRHTAVTSTAFPYVFCIIISKLWKQQLTKETF